MDDLSEKRIIIGNPSIETGWQLTYAPHCTMLYCDGFDFKPPHWFHRFMQRLLLGWEWAYVTPETISKSE